MAPINVNTDLRFNFQRLSDDPKKNKHQFCVNVPTIEKSYDFPIENIFQGIKK